MSQQSNAIVHQSVFHLNDRYKDVGVSVCVRMLFLNFDNNHVDIDPLIHAEGNNAFVEVVIGGNNSGPILQHVEVPFSDLIACGIFAFPDDFSLENYAMFVHGKITQFEENQEHAELVGATYEDLEIEINNTIAGNIPGIADLVERISQSCISNYEYSVRQLGAAFRPQVQ